MQNETQPPEPTQPEPHRNGQPAVDALYARMNPLQRALTLAYMQGVLTPWAAYPSATPDFV